MYAVTLTENGEFVKLLGFANNVEECEAIANRWAKGLGGFEAMVELGYAINVELAC